MTIVLCGGGSGGHITPLLAVASEFKKRDPTVRLIYIGERNGKFAGIAESSHLFDELHYISAGKLRRYYGESWLRRILDVKTLIFNIRDIFRLIKGLVQSYFLLKKLNPQAILLKGGFVCVPVAIAAHKHNLPYITHDSDALPGLSNRIAARWARYHATALPAKYYNYPPSTVREVGVPSDERFRPYSESEKRILQEKYGAGEAGKVLLITGGSNGARRLNKAVVNILPKLLSNYPDLYIFHQTGAGNDDQLEIIRHNPEVASRVRFFDFSNELFHLSAIADVVITRAGASAMTDYGQQKKACIVVPNPYLTGGHQLKNAEVYQDARAALIVYEKDLQTDPDRLYQVVDDLLKNKDKRKQLSEDLHSLTSQKDAAAELVNLLQEIAR